MPAWRMAARCGARQWMRTTWRETEQVKSATMLSGPSAMRTKRATTAACQGCNTHRPTLRAASGARPRKTSSRKPSLCCRSWASARQRCVGSDSKQRPSHETRSRSSKRKGAMAQARAAVTAARGSRASASAGCSTFCWSWKAGRTSRRGSPLRVGACAGPWKDHSRTNFSRLRGALSASTTAKRSAGSASAGKTSLVVLVTPLTVY